MDYRYLRWQVVDTPGILDHSLEERNTIEMQAITALAHLRAAVLYVMDISEQCGHGIEEQIALFENIRPLFANKPLVIALNKIDVISLDEIRDEARQAIDGLILEGLPVIPMSTVEDKGVMDVRNKSCDLLLAQRVEIKLKSKKMPEVLNRLHLAVPTPRDDRERPPFIPPGVKLKKSTASRESKDVEDMEVPSSLPVNKLKLERDIELEEGDDYLLDLKKRYLLPNPNEKYDVIPEIVNGKNIADFIDSDILSRLDQLEKEEELRERAGEYVSESEDEDTLQNRELANKIRKKRVFLHKLNISKRVRNHPVMPRTNTRASRGMVRPDDSGVAMEEDSSVVVTPLIGGKKRKREASQSASRAKSIEGRSLSRVSRDVSGVRDGAQLGVVRKKMKRSQSFLSKKGRKGESDRAIVSKMPKHLFAGKRKSGKTSRR
jgi:nucleolar GTP-binding protein